MDVCLISTALMAKNSELFLWLDVGTFFKYKSSANIIIGLVKYYTDRSFVIYVQIELEDHTNEI
jgi:hypothetical protein